VRGERPQDILFGAEFPEPQSVGINIIETPQLPGLDQFANADKDRVILQQMADHQHAP
jgi:hypothetical protein